MEAFSLLANHLRGAATTFTEGGDTANTIIAAAVSPYSSDGEDGPYFDLEFALPEDDIDEEEPTEKDQEDDNKSRKPENGGHGSSYGEDSDHEKETTLNSTVTSDGCTEENVTTSDVLLFNGELVPIESSSVLLHDSDQNCKFPVSVLKAAAKFGVVLLKLKKSKPEQTENMSKKEGNHGEMGRKFFAFKFKVEEVKMPFSSLFSKENDSKVKKQGGESKQNGENLESDGVQEDRKSKKHYFKMVKPLYVRISKGYVGKLKFYGQLDIPGAETCSGILPPVIAAEKGKDGNVKVVDAAASGHSKTSPKQWIQMGLLAGKSRPASAAVAAVPMTKMACNRRDDSLLQVQDGIQGAILHCKRSFNDT
ncbi:putative membrane-associated kinase regulator 2 [Primulina tabacum]|uniref:putative membrane-associated kinase regulator 2 n=1 Tax=Primulina tabacum TaxID=48773 RepID=UPI003F5A4D0A